MERHQLSNLDTEKMWSSFGVKEDLAKTKANKNRGSGTYSHMATSTEG